MCSSTKDYKEKHFTFEKVENFNDILPGQYIWFSKEGNVGQYRVVDVDKEHNKLTYTDGHELTKEINFDYSKSRNYEFFSNAPDAFNDAREYANTYFNIKNPGTPFAHAVYKSQDQLSIERVKQMLFD